MSFVSSQRLLVQLLIEDFANRALDLGENYSAIIPNVFLIQVFYRRICLGRRMANTALFIDVASILWAANISPVKDKAGKPIIPDTLETLNAGAVV